MQNYATKSMTCILASIAVAAWFLLPAGVQAGVVTDKVRSTADQVLEILNKPELKASDAKQERRNRLHEVIFSRFDFDEMSRRSLGPTWDRITSAQQQEFVRLFSQLLEESYVKNIEGYNGEKILYCGETQNQDYAQVDTKIVNKQGEEIPINYRLHNVDGEWKAYDVVIENISVVNNYHSQFSRLLAKSSFANLLDTIRQKLPPK